MGNPAWDGVLLCFLDKGVLGEFALGVTAGVSMSNRDGETETYALMLPTMPDWQWLPFGWPQ